MSDVSTRYAPERAFPAYAFLPGRDPHPVRDPRGHSHGQTEVAAVYLLPGSWRENEDYLWEAHEAWEGLWHKAKHDALQAEHLQGLIQCAAASLKIPMQQPRGVEKLGELGTARLSRVAAGGHPVYMGLDVLDFVERFREFYRSSPESADERPRIELE